ncbi:MAG: LytTR family DNA-binding domain-containing protein, partial [Bacteroidales bacterium]|nr:LytTR family DNA-binding domain-containing protein [Bacteroidales bacterium]
IIEDEPHARNELKRLLAKSKQDIDVVDCIDSVEDAVNWFNNNAVPDLLFLDIQLSDGLSFEIFSHIEIKAPVIFTTAFDEYALQAFKVNSIDYLLKPIKFDELEKAIQKYHSIKDQYNTEGPGLNTLQIEKLLNIYKPTYKLRFLVKIGDQIKHIDIKNVAYFKAEDNEVLLVTSDNSRYIIDYSLDQLGELLNPASFYRATRRYIITVNAIKKISKYFNSRLILELSPLADDTVLVSRVKVTEFLKWIDQ